MDSVKAAQRLLDATRGWFPRPVDQTALSTSELALAGLARCRRLLTGMIELHETGSDLAGAHGRTLYEMWITSLYLAFGGDEALARVEANDAHEQRRHARAFIGWLDGTDDPDSRLLEQSRSVLDEPAPEIGRLALKDMAIQVRGLTREPGVEPSDFYEQAYVFLYGPESYISVHGGLDAMRRQIQGSPAEVSASAWPYRGADRRLDLAIAMVASLANVVADHLCLDRSALDRFATEWPSYLG